MARGKQGRALDRTTPITRLLKPDPMSITAPVAMVLPMQSAASTDGYSSSASVPKRFLSTSESPSLPSRSAGERQCVERHVGRLLLVPSDTAGPDARLARRKEKSLDGAWSCTVFDRRAPETEDEVAFSVTGNGTILGLGRTRADQDLLADESLPLARTGSRDSSARPERRQAVSSRRSAPRPWI